MQNFDAIIIGQGYAGLKAAHLAAAKGLRVAAVEAMFPGGLIMSINELHPAPEGEAACGPELTGTLAMENMDNGTHNVSAPTDSISQLGSGAWQVEAGGEVLQAKNLILASGARLRKLGVPGEAEFEGRGVSACADCDGPIFMGKEAVIVGGGDSAFQEAVALALYVSKVTIIMRGAASRAQAELVAGVEGHAQVEVVAGAQVSEIVGTASDGVTGVRIIEAGGERIVPCSVVFPFIGLDPATEGLPASIALDGQGAVVTGDDLRGSAGGLWAIGAVRSGFGGLLTDAAADAEKVINSL